jgi:hypothetical protein
LAATSAHDAELDAFGGERQAGGAEGEEGQRQPPDDACPAQAVRVIVDHVGCSLVMWIRWF